MEPRSHFQQTAKAAAEPSASVGWFCDSGEDLQQRALAGAIASNDPDSVATFEVEGNILQGPDHALAVGMALESAERGPGGLGKDVAQRFVSRLRADAVAFA